MKTFVVTNHRRIGKKARMLACGLGMLAVVAAQAQTLQITTVAGYAGKGSTDGTGANALFLNAQGVAVDAAGNLYVADSGNNTIRVITSGGISRTLAGRVGVAGSADGSGTNAFFSQPSGIALDSLTNVYVSDYNNNTIRKITPAGAVTTIAGKVGVAGSLNATGTNATFFHPMGIAVDSANSLYIADYGNHLIRKITSGNVVGPLAGSAGVFGLSNGTGTGAIFYEPEGVAVDTSGNVYVADTGNAVIRKITSGGVTTTFAGSGLLGSLDTSSSTASFYQPAGIAVTSAGIVYVADYFNNNIRRIVGSTVTTIAGLAGTTGSTDVSTTNARFSAPQGLAVNSAGTVYVADTGNSTIRMISSGNVTTFAGSASAGAANGTTATSRFYNPRNVVVDASGNIYVADTQNSVIRKIDSTGMVTVFSGTVGVFGSQDGPGASALFSGPQGLALDSAGNIYVADTGNDTIRVITSAGAVSTLAGLAGNPGNADGTGTAAQFNEPKGVAVDNANNVYVADTWNHTIRKIAGGTSSTLAGLPGTAGSFDGTNTSAQFNCPTGITVDSSGNLYVTDYYNNTIRKVTSAGVVTTLAGFPGIWGNTDSSNSAALFSAPTGISRDASGNLFVVDSGNDTVRKVSPSGTNWVVTTVAGLPDVIGSTDGTGTAVGFNYPTGIAISAAGYVYVADSGNNTIRSQGIAPTIITQPQSQTNLVGTTVVFSVGASGSTPLTYIWQYNGTNLAPSSINSLSTSNAGTYSVTVSNLAGFAVSSNAVLVLTNLPVVVQPGVFQGITAQPNGTVHLNLSGTTNATYTLAVSTNLITWSNLVTFTMTNGAVLYNDSGASNFPRRFYRLISP